MLRILGMGVFWLYAQTCEHYLEGKVLDKDTRQPISHIQVRLSPWNLTTYTDSLGFFRFSGLCGKTCKMHFHPLGYEKWDTTIRLPAYVEISLSPASLDTVTISTEKMPIQSPIYKLSPGQLEITQHMSQAIEKLPGSEWAAAGPTLGRPQLLGLQGNRVMLLYQGVPWATHSWAADHSPEIELSFADKIQVRLGPQGVRYGAGALGGALEWTLNQETCDKPFSFQLPIAYQHNGHSFALAPQVKGSWKNLTYYLRGKVLTGGTLWAPRYSLANTAQKHAHWIGGAKYLTANAAYEVDFFQYNAQIGIPWAAHVGTLSDLYRALRSPLPLSTGPFTYEVKAPYQAVEHEFFRASHTRTLAQGLVKITYSRQLNLRSEYDARGVYNLSGRPALDLQLLQHYGEMLYKTSRYQLGITAQHQENKNFGSYLLPNYYTTLAAIYGIYTAAQWEGGLRLESFHQKVTQPLRVIERNLPPQRIPLYQKTYFQPTFFFSYFLRQRRWSHVFHLTSGWRPAHPAELFSYGIHASQGVFLMGNPDLTAEKMYSLTWQAQGTTLRPAVTVSYAPEFIYLRPDTPAFLTLRGPAPVLRYEKDAAFLISFYPSWSFTHKTWNYEGKITYSWGHRPYKGPLFGIAQPQILHTLQWTRTPLCIAISQLIALRQSRYDPSQDYAAPPAGFIRYDLRLSLQLPSPWKIHITIQNLFNAPYRVYTDFFRYYMDALGRQVAILCIYQL
ncbi:MAG: TonB-dependent receptor plug domain-containing protein [Bacteroidia bacterium]